MDQEGVLLLNIGLKKSLWLLEAENVVTLSLVPASIRWSMVLLMQADLAMCTLQPNVCA